MHLVFQHAFNNSALRASLLNFIFQLRASRVVGKSCWKPRCITPTHIETDILLFHPQRPHHSPSPQPTDFHSLIQATTNDLLYVQILPFTQRTLTSNDPIWTKFPNVCTNLLNKPPSPQRHQTLFLHRTVKNLYKTYGVYAKSWRRKSVNNYFNSYKRAL